MAAVRLGIIGLGAIGRVHLDRIKEFEEGEVTVVSDIDPSLTEAISKEFGVPGFADYRKLLASGLAEAVVVATPPPLHAEISIAAMTSGHHCLTEKPMAVTVEDADRMIATAKETGRILAVLYPFRTLPWMRKAKEIIAAGGLGEIRRTLMTYATYRSQNYYDSRGWRGTWKGEGGGVLMNQGTHRIDQFVHLAGRPSRVIGMARAGLHRIEAEDEAAALLEYPNGAWGYFYTTTSEVPMGLAIEILGEKGKLTFRDGALTFHRFKTSISDTSAAATELERQQPGMWMRPEVTTEAVAFQKVAEKDIINHGEILPNFCRAILHGEPLIAPATEARDAVEFANGLILSNSESRPVDLPVDRPSYRRLYEGLVAKSADGAAPRLARSGA